MPELDQHLKEELVSFREKFNKLRAEIAKVCCWPR